MGLGIAVVGVLAFWMFGSGKKESGHAGPHAVPHARHGRGSAHGGHASHGTQASEQELAELAAEQVATAPVLPQTPLHAASQMVSRPGHPRSEVLVTGPHVQGHPHHDRHLVRHHPHHAAQSHHAKRPVHEPPAHVRPLSGGTPSLRPQRAGAPVEHASLVPDPHKAARIAPQLARNLATHHKLTYSRQLTRQFQLAVGLVADGLYGPRTRAELARFNHGAAPAAFY